MMVADGTDESSQSNYKFIREMSQKRFIWEWTPKGMIASFSEYLQSTCPNNSLNIIQSKYYV